MPPITVMIKPVSSMCNMHCRYCFYYDVASCRSQSSLGMMSLETLENTVKRVMSYADESASFSFQGGEPTLAGIDFYKKLIEYQQRYNAKGIEIHNAIQTNGLDLSDRFISFLKENKFLVGVSYDGVAELHDAMRVDVAGKATSMRVKNTIDRLQSQNVDFNILCVVNNYVAQHPKEVFNALAGYKYIQFIPCLDGFSGEKKKWSLDEKLYASFLKESFELYYAAFKNHNIVSIRNFDNYIGILLGHAPESCGMCGRCALYWLIEADGTVYPCDFYVLDEWCLGNINSSSLFKLAKSEVQEKFVQDSLYIDKECKQCHWFALCRGGCRREREPFSNGKPTLNRHCAAYKEFFTSSIEKMKEIAEYISESNNR